MAKMLFKYHHHGCFVFQALFVCNRSAPSVVLPRVARRGTLLRHPPPQHEGTGHRLTRHSAPAGPPHVRVCDACAAVCGHRRTARACRERRHLHRRLPCGLRQWLQRRRPSHGPKPQAPPAPGSMGRPKLGAKVVPELEGGCVCDSGGWQGPGSWFLHLLRTRSGIPILSQSAWNHPQECTGQRTRPLAGSWPGGGSPGPARWLSPGEAAFLLGAFVELVLGSFGKYNECVSPFTISEENEDRKAMGQTVTASSA